MQPITWTCHVCGQERPDEMIGVARLTRTVRGLVAQVNVRFCRDKEDCVSKAASGKVAFLSTIGFGEC